MTRPVIPFETRVSQQLRRGRPNSPESGPTLGGYGAIDDSIRALIGNDVGPYQNIIGRASVDGETGLVEVTDGESQIVATDLFGRLWTRVTESPPEPIPGVLSAHGTGSTLTISAPATLYQMRAIVPAAVDTDRYLQAFDADATPANGTFPRWEMLLPKTATAVEAGDDFGAIQGLAFAVGITLANSSTRGVLTLSTAITIFMTYRPS